MLGMPQSQLRVVPLEIGGGFGGKIAIHGEAVAVRLAQKCGRPVKLVFTREEVLQGGSGPAAGALIDIAVGADAEGRLVAIEGTYRMDAGGLPGLSPSLLMQASAALYQCPNLEPAGLRRRHQQAAHGGLSRARRHPGRLRHGAGHGRAVPAVGHGPAGVPQAQRLRHRQHHADRHAVPRHRPHHHPRPRGPPPLLDRSAARGPLSARPRPGARLLARHVDDLGRPHHHRRRRPPDGDDGRRRPLGHAHHHGAGGGGGVRAAHRRHPHPHRRHQVGGLQRRRRRQPRGAHHDGSAGRGQPRRAGPAADARGREAAVSHPTSSTMPAASSARARPAALPSRSPS